MRLHWLQLRKTDVIMKASNKGEVFPSLGFPDSSVGKESTSNVGDLDLIPGLGRSLGEEMATQSSILARRIPWTV